MERLLMIGQRGKAVSPDVLTEHVKGLRSEVRSITLIYIDVDCTSLNKISIYNIASAI